MHLYLSEPPPRTRNKQLQFLLVEDGDIGPRDHLIQPLAEGLELVLDAAFEPPGGGGE